MEYYKILFYITINNISYTILALFMNIITINILIFIII